MYDAIKEHCKDKDINIIDILSILSLRRQPESPEISYLSGVIYSGQVYDVRCIETLNIPDKHARNTTRNRIGYCAQIYHSDIDKLGVEALFTLTDAYRQSIKRVQILSKICNFEEKYTSDLEQLNQYFPNLKEYEVIFSTSKATPDSYWSLYTGIPLVKFRNMFNSGLPSMELYLVKCPIAYANSGKISFFTNDYVQFTISIRSDIRKIGNYLCISNYGAQVWIKYMKPCQNVPPEYTDFDIK